MVSFAQEKAENYHDHLAKYLKCHLKSCKKSFHECFDGLGIISSKNMHFHDNRPPCIHNYHGVETWRDGVSEVGSTRMGAQ